MDKTRYFTAEMVIHFRIRENIKKIRLIREIDIFHIQRQTIECPLFIQWVISTGYKGKPMIKSLNYDKTSMHGFP